MTRSHRPHATLIVGLVLALIGAASAMPAQADPTGFTWTARNGGANDFADVAYGNGVYVAVGATDVVATSTDAVTWTGQSDIPGMQSWTSIAYGGGTFVAVGIENPEGQGATEVIMTSPDGVTWTTRTVAGGNTNKFTNVTYGNGIFIALQSEIGDNDTVYTSPDGVTWTPHATPANASTWVDAAYGAGIFVAVGGVGSYPETQKCIIMTSPDGANWTCRSTAVGATDVIGAIAYGDGKFIGGGASQFHVSTDGVNWSVQASPVTSYFTAAAYGAGQFAFYGFDESGNSVTWVTLTSPDGMTWTSRTSINGDFWQALTYGNGVMVGVGGASAATPTLSVQTSGIPGVPSVMTSSTGRVMNPSWGYFNTLIAGVPTSRVDSPITSQAGAAVTGVYPTPTLGKRAKASWTLASTNAAGANFPPKSGKKLRLGTGQYLSYSGSSMKPGSTVSAYLGFGASQTLLGSTLVDATGKYEDSAFIPLSMNKGNLSVNLVGTLGDGSVVSNAIGVTLRGGNAMIITYPTTKVLFSRGSAKLTNSAKRALDVSFAQADREHVLTAIVKVTYSKGKVTLAKKRGAKVKNYLANNGITGGIEVQLAKGSASSSNTVRSQLAMGQ